MSAEAEAKFRGVAGLVSIEDWPDDPRYVKVSLYVEPQPPGTDFEAYSLLVKAPEAVE